MAVKIVEDVLNRSSGFLRIIVYFSTILGKVLSAFNNNNSVLFTYGAEDGMHNKLFTIRKKIGYTQVPK
jgi:hypothetical protein